MSASGALDGGPPSHTRPVGDGGFVGMADADAGALPSPMTDAEIGSRPDAGDAGESDASEADAGEADAAVQAAPGFVFSPYKAASVHMNWNTHVLSTTLSGDMTPLAEHMTQHGANAVTIAFASGECGSETLAGVAGDVIAAANVPVLSQANIRYAVSTGGAGASFTCASDTGFTAFLERWLSPALIGIDFDVESGQTAEQLLALMQRVDAAHATYPTLRFSLTLATSAKNEGASRAIALGDAAPNSLNTTGQRALDAVKNALGFTGDAATWPPYVTVNLMTMDYGSAGADRCVVSEGSCQMGQSALQAAFDLHDRWGVPYANIELTPMIGGNDVMGEKFTLADVDVIAAFARSHHLAGIHYWSYDRDTDCAEGATSPTCNSMGMDYAGPAGYLARFLDGLN